MSTLGNNLFALRRVFNISQNQLAEIAGVSSDLIASCEIGSDNLPPDSLLNIASHFNCNREIFFFDGGVARFFESQKKKFTISVEEMNLIINYRKLPSNIRRAVRDISSSFKQ